MNSLTANDPGLDSSYLDYQFVAEFYDHVIPYRDRPDVAFYCEEAERSGGPVLELGCGTGRILIPTARAGIEITGVDLSKHMLETCRRRLKREEKSVRAKVELIQADMSEVDTGKRYILVTSPFRAFQHLLTVDAQMRSIKNAYRHLIPGGFLVMDVFNPSLQALTAKNEGEEFAEEPEFKLPDGRSVVRTHRIVARDPIHQISDIELIYNVSNPDGREERLVHAFKMRHLFRFELEHLLARCGFELEAVYCDFNRRPYGAIYPGELIFVARKPN